MLIFEKKNDVTFRENFLWISFVNDPLQQLKMDIKEIQSQGVIVKLAYGGEEWGNTDAEAKV